MIYIHNLDDLNPKSAEIETTYLLREIKLNESIPLTQEKLRNKFLLFFVSKTDLDAMSQALRLVPSVLDEIVELSKTEGFYEKINLQRAYLALQEIPDALKRNLDYANGIFEWQESFIEKITGVLNKTQSLKTKDEQAACEKELDAFFEKILCSKDFIFNYKGLISEGQLTRINNLLESISNGFIFHITIGEYLKKENFNTIKNRIPKEELAKVDAIIRKLVDIKNGVERAYSHNMRMINLALVLYAYVRWLKDK